jgi:hypothetical protein
MVYFVHLTFNELKDIWRYLRTIASANKSEQSAACADYYAIPSEHQ